MAAKPVKKGRVSSGYGYRINPFDKSRREFHPGIDIAPPADGSDPNPEIFNVWKSKIVVIGESTSFGKRVWVKLLDGPYKTLFMVFSHMKSINHSLKKGMIINEGEFIGFMGSTGLSTGVHTHLEIRYNPLVPGDSKNPIEISKMYEV